MDRSKQIPFINCSPFQNHSDYSSETLSIPDEIINIFLKDEKESFHNLLSLYIFYYYTYKWGKTDLSILTNSHTAKELGWSESKVQRIKKRLTELGLI